MYMYAFMYVCSPLERGLNIASALIRVLPTAVLCIWELHVHTMLTHVTVSLLPRATCDITPQPCQFHLLT